jgi:hypothetical protein
MQNWSELVFNNSWDRLNTSRKCCYNQHDHHFKRTKFYESTLVIDIAKRDSTD